MLLTYDYIYQILPVNNPGSKGEYLLLFPSLKTLLQFSVSKMPTSFLLYGAALLPFISLSALANNVVDLGYAQYRGNLTFPDTVAYLGLPFAEPPVGDRRWRSPLPLNTTRIQEESNGAVIDATAYPDFCIQGTTGGASSLSYCARCFYMLMKSMSVGDAGGAGSEDCLKVNVYAPANATINDQREWFFVFC